MCSKPHPRGADEGQQRLEVRDLEGDFGIAIRHPQSFRDFHRVADVRGKLPNVLNRGWHMEADLCPLEVAASVNSRCRDGNRCKALLMPPSIDASTPQPTTTLSSSPGKLARRLSSLVVL